MPLKGVPRSEEAKRKIAIGHLGQPRYKGGKPKCLECGIQLASYYSKRCHLHANRLIHATYDISGKVKSKMKGRPAHNKGVKMSDETRRKMSISKRGDKSHLWQGGIAKKNRTDRENFMSSVEYKIWRDKVFIRDGYQCLLCGAKSGNGKRIYLNADHIKPYILYPELRLEVSNGRTLCVDCHRKTDTWGGRSFRYIQKTI